MARLTPSTIHSHRTGAELRAPLLLAGDALENAAANPEQFARIGIDILGAMDASDMADQRSFFGMDDLTQIALTTAGMIPAQFLQAWMPGLVRLLTQARKIDEIIGVMTVGDWEDEEIIQGILEPTGIAVPYTDLGNIPLANWNLNYDRRTIVRFESGIRVGKLEAARSAKARINDAAEKRGGAAISLDIQRNRIGFLGFNGGANRTYGFLNDPNLSAYVTVANGTAGTPQWSTKSFLEITRDIRGFAAALRIASGDNIDAVSDATTLAVATASIDYLSTTSDFGISVWDWIKQTYPKMRVISAPELSVANGGANVAYLSADRVDNGGDDGGATWAQAVPVKFFTIGTEVQAKAYVEDFGNATAGVFLKRPFAVRRFTGI